MSARLEEAEFGNDESVAMMAYAEQCAVTMICYAKQLGLESFRLRIRGMTANSVDMGEWLISVDRTDSKMVS